MNFADATGFHFLKFCPVNLELSTFSTEFSTTWFVAKYLPWSGLHATPSQLPETQGTAGIGNLYRQGQW